MTDLTNWMGSLADSTSLASMSIPGTHESGSRHYAVVIRDWAQCQNESFTITRQLEAGARYLDIRLRNFNNALLLHHESVYQQGTFRDVVNQCDAFLKAHPTETVLMRIRHEYTNDQQGDDHTPEGFRARFDEVSKEHPDLFRTGWSVPSLSEARRKIVVINENGGLSGIQWKQSPMDVQDDWNPDSSKVKVGEVKAQFDKSRADGSGATLYVNHLSCYRKIPDGSPAEMTHVVVPPVIDYLYTSTGASGQGPLGVVPMDYMDEDARPVVDHLVWWNRNAVAGKTHTLKIDTAELVQFDDGSTDPAVFGSITLATHDKRIKAWDRDDDHTVKFADSKGTFKLDTATATSDHGFSIQVDLWDYDASSGNDRVAYGAAYWAQGDAAGTFTHTFTGEDKGEVKIVYTIS
ncbi:phosphatidylinositol-specific phospholipase C [Streptomyces sp. NPDC017979]|uniref:phosphatidylinositol-specific phospholipase C n=1 Tax=Streptomyces sp. NPDC017979 TaxID=3365024 RepID=UPI0037A443C8